MQSGSLERPGSDAVFDNEQTSVGESTGSRHCRALITSKCPQRATDGHSGCDARHSVAFVHSEGNPIFSSALSQRGRERRISETDTRVSAAATRWAL